MRANPRTSSKRTSPASTEDSHSAFRIGNTLSNSAEKSLSPLIKIESQHSSFSNPVLKQI